MTSRTAVARAKALQHLAPYPAHAVLRRLRISQDDVAYVAGRSQGHVGAILRRRAPLDGAVIEAVRVLVPLSVASDEELWGES
jgi:hypothetical protein